MSGVAPKPAVEPMHVSGQNRGPVEHLLHALNQPLTGLQCSMELAVAGPHPAEYYRRTLEEGLELVCRARVLVEALREIVDLQDAKFREVSRFRIDNLLREITAEFEPVGVSKGVHMQLYAAAPLFVYGSRRHLSSALLRLLDSILALCADRVPVQIAMTPEEDRACLMISWTQATAAMPFSLSELGLLISQAAWERAGGTWARGSVASDQTCIISIPLATLPDSQGGSLK